MRKGAVIRSSQTTLKFCNSGKRTDLDLFISEYRDVVGKFVDLLWDRDKIPTLLPKEDTSKIQTWLSARALQAAGKQASGLVRGTKKKYNARVYMESKLRKSGDIRGADRLKKIISRSSLSKPVISEVCPELDSRFVSFCFDNPTSFDGWLVLSSLGNKLKIKIPVKKTRHFNKMLSRGGVLKTGVRLSRKSLTLMFDLPDIAKKTTGSVLGIDIGQSTMLSCSDDQVSCKDNHGHDLKTITDILSRRVRGSKGFRRAKQHRANYINWSINRLNLNGFSELRLEKIVNLRRGKSTSRGLSHWTYAGISGKLVSKCEEQGVLVTHVSPVYTSQRCSKCGWTRKANRKGKLFRCNVCGFSIDSDLNASRNIALDLKPIGFKTRHQYDNRTGFYWTIDGQECIVPVVDLKSVS